MRADTMDEQDERLTHPNGAESAVSKELEREGAQKRAIARGVKPKARPKAASRTQARDGKRTYRVRVTVTTDATEQEIRDAFAHVSKGWQGRVTRVREVLE